MAKPSPWSETQEIAKPSCGPYVQKTSSLQTLKIESHFSSQTCLLDPAEHHKPCLLVELYAITSPAYSTVYNKQHTDFPPDSICLSFLHSFDALNQICPLGQWQGLSSYLPRRKLGSTVCALRTLFHW